MDNEIESGLEIKYFQSQLINNDIFQKFENSDYNTVDLILFSDIYPIQKQTGLDLHDIQKVQINLQKIFSSIPINGQQLYYERCNMSVMLSTGSETLDEVLGGCGMLSGEIIEVFGTPSSGKTQISMFCSLNVAQEYKQNVLYVDASNSFSPQRIVEMYHNRPSHDDEDDIFAILDRIKLCNCYDASHLFEVLNQIDIQLENDKRNSNDNTFHSKLRLIVIDSIGTLLSPILGGKQTQGHFVMMAISRLMKTIADKFQIVFLVINNTVINQTSKDRDNENKSALGESWLAISNHQLMIHHKYTDDESEERSISIEKSTRIKKTNQAFQFQITSSGIS